MRRSMAALAALALLFSLAGCTKEETPVSAQAGIPVETAVVPRAAAALESRLSGRVTAARDVPVYVKTAAEVTEIYVKNGDAVREGEVLFVMDGGDVQDQYDTARRSYERTKALLDAQLASARKSAEEAKTLTDEQVRLAEENAENTRALLEIGAASQLEADSAAVTAMQARISAESTLRQAELGVQQAESTAESTLESLEDTLDTLSELLADTAVKAPIAGVVSGLAVTKGAMAAPQMAACVVSEQGRAQVALGVSETVRGYLKAGDEVTVTIASLSQEPFTAAVRSVSPTPNQLTQLYDVRVDLPEELEAASGLFADVTVRTERREDTVLVPTGAILNDGAQSYVYIVTEGGTASRVTVTTGLVLAAETEITDGLSGGETLVTKGQSYLSDGAAVRVVTGGDAA